MGMGMFGGLYKATKTAVMNHPAVKFLRTEGSGDILFNSTVAAIKDGQEAKRQIYRAGDAAVASMHRHVPKMGGLGIAMTPNKNAVSEMWGMNAVRAAGINAGVGGVMGATMDGDDRGAGFMQGAGMGVGAGLIGRGGLSAYAKYGSANMKAKTAAAYSRVMTRMGDRTFYRQSTSWGKNGGIIGPQLSLPGGRISGGQNWRFGDQDLASGQADMAQAARAMQRQPIALGSSPSPLMLTGGR